MSSKKSSKDRDIHNRHFVPAGDTVIEQGEKGNTAYLIQSGSVRVYREENGKTAELGKLGPGDIVGEMALIVDEPRTATVKALENTTFITITRPMMIERMAKTDPLIKALTPMLIKRLETGNKKALGGNDSFEDLMVAITTIYNNIHNGLPPQKKRSMEKAVLPKIDEFLKAVENFQKLYGD